MTYATFVKAQGAHGLGVEWLKVCVGTLALCEQAAAQWAQDGHTVEVAAL